MICGRGNSDVNVHVKEVEFLFGKIFSKLSHRQSEKVEFTNGAPTNKLLLESHQ